MVILANDARAAFRDLQLFGKSDPAHTRLAQEQMHIGAICNGDTDRLTAYIDETDSGLAIVQLRQKGKETGQFAPLKHNLFLGPTNRDATDPRMTTALQVRRIDENRRSSHRVVFPNPNGERSLLHIPGFGFAAFASTYGQTYLFSDENTAGIEPGKIIAGPFRRTLQGAAVLGLVEGTAFQFITEPLELGRKDFIKAQFEPGQVITVEQVEVDPPVELDSRRRHFVEDPAYQTYYEIKVQGRDDLNARVDPKSVRKFSEMSQFIGALHVSTLKNKIGLGFGNREGAPDNFLVASWPKGILIKDTRSNVTVFVPRAEHVNKPTSFDDGLLYAQARALMVV